MKQTLKNIIGAIHSGCHEMLILVASLTVLCVSSYSFYLEASSRDVAPLEWLYYPLGAMFLLLPNTAIRIIKALRGIPDGSSSNANAAESGPAPKGVD